MKTNKIKSAGYCSARTDLLKKNLSVPIGKFQQHSSYPLPYRWLKDDDGFQIFYCDNWEDAESIDFNFLDTEKEIIKAHFKAYSYSNTIEEINGWSAKDLKELLRICGYKSWTKDIMTYMVKDLVKIHAFKFKTIEHNPFLVKQN